MSFAVIITHEECVEAVLTLTLYEHYAGSNKRPREEQSDTVGKRQKIVDLDPVTKHGTGWVYLDPSLPEQKKMIQGHNIKIRSPPKPHKSEKNIKIQFYRYLTLMVQCMLLGCGHPHYHGAGRLAHVSQRSDVYPW